MTVYFMAYGLIALSTIIKFGKTPEKKRKNQCVFIFLVLFFLLAFRHPSMGIDLGYGKTSGYLAQYRYISGLSWQDVFFRRVVNYERGYIILNKLLSLISANEQVLLIGCAALSLGAVFYEIYQQSPSPAVSAFVFMGLSTFLLVYSGLRQSIAVGICFLAISLIVEKRPWKFVVYILVASIFHDSAWIFLIAYPLYHLSMKYSWRIFTCFIPPILYIFRYSLFQVFSRLFKDNAQIDNNNAIVLFLVFYLVYVFCWLFSSEKKDLTGLKNLFFVACCIQALSGVNSIVIRVGYYFMNSLIILLPMVTKQMRSRENAQIWNIVISICFIIFGLYSIYSSTWAKAYPYKWFWDNSL